MFMETHRFEYSIQSMANVLGVSRSGFYQFLKRSKNELEKYNPFNILSASFWYRLGSKATEISLFAFVRKCFLVI